MTRTSLHWLAGILVAVVASSGLYWFIGDVALAAVTGLTWGSGHLITLRIARQHPSHTTGEGWRDKRWTGLSAGLINPRCAYRRKSGAADFARFPTRTVVLS